MANLETQTFLAIELVQRVEIAQWRQLINRAHEGSCCDTESPLSYACQQGLVEVERLPVVGIYPFVFRNLDSLEGDMLQVLSSLQHETKFELCIDEDLQFAKSYWQLAMELAKANKLLCRMVLGLPIQVVNLLASKDFDLLKMLVFITRYPQTFEILGCMPGLYSKNTDPCLQSLEDWIRCTGHKASPQKTVRKNNYLNRLMGLWLPFRRIKVLTKLKESTELDVNQLVRFLVRLEISQPCLTRFLVFLGFSEKDAALRSRRELRGKTRETEVLVRYEPEDRRAIGDAFRFYFLRSLHPQMKSCDVVRAFALAVLLGCRVRNIQLSDPVHWGRMLTLVERQFRKEWMSW